MASEITNPQDLAPRYVALWNEPDAEARRRAIRQLWTENASHTLLSPPQEMRDAARGMGFPAPPLELRGHEALETRVTLAYDQFVAPGEHRFRLARADDLAGVVAVTWELVSAATGEVAARGIDILVLDHDGRIQANYLLIPT